MEDGLLWRKGRGVSEGVRKGYILMWESCEGERYKDRGARRVGEKDLSW